MPIRAALLPFLVLLCASVACQINAPTTQAVQGTERANGAFSSSANPDELQGTPSANLSHKSPLPSPFYTVTTNAAGTLAVMSLNATQTEESAAHQAVTETKSVSLTQSAYIVQTQTAIPPAQTAAAKANATIGAGVSIHATELSIGATQTQEYPSVIILAAQAQADAQFAPLRSFAGAIGGIVGPLAVLVIAVGMVIVIARRQPQLAATTDAEEEPIEREESSPLGTPQYPGAIIVSIPQYIASDRQLKIVADALAKGASLTHANFTPFEKCFSEGGFTKFCDYLLDNVPPFAVLTNPSIKNSAIEPLPSLRHYLKRYATPTAPSAKVFTPDTTIQPVGRQTDAPTDTRNGAGEGVSDHFNVIDPATRAQFTPGRDTLNAGLDATDKDETK